MGTHPLLPPSRAVKFALRDGALKDLRGRLGLATDKELADLIGVTLSTYYRILSGASEPGVQFVAGLADLIGFPALSELFDIVPKTARTKKTAA